jgi:LacI family transcriptional regulator
MHTDQSTVRHRSQQQRKHPAAPQAAGGSKPGSLDIREIASRARVSTATVSRAINGVPSVASHLAKRVWKVINETGYYPDVRARSLVSGRSRTLGLIVSEITNPFFPEIIQVFENVAVDNNFEILVASTIHDSEQTRLSVRRMIERRVAGVAVITFGNEESLLQDLQLRNIPLVFVDVGPAWPRISNIRVDYHCGLREAVQHLAALRHTDIAFVSGPLDLKTARARQNAFSAALKEIRLSVRPEYMVQGDHTMEGGMAVAGPLLHSNRPPTAIICSNDMTAIGVMRKARELGLQIPRDLSLIGFDDIRLARYVIPSLTTVQMPQDKLARLAFEALVADVQRKLPQTKGSEYVLQTSLVVRDSTGESPLAESAVSHAARGVSE